MEEEGGGRSCCGSRGMRSEYRAGGGDLIMVTMKLIRHGERMSAAKLLISSNDLRGLPLLVSGGD